MIRAEDSGFVYVVCDEDSCWMDSFKSYDAAYVRAKKLMEEAIQNRPDDSHRLEIHAVLTILESSPNPQIIESTHPDFEEQDAD